MEVNASIVRWKRHGHVIAYSYSMIPVKAHKVNGSWKVVVEVAGVFTASFIDEGEDVFSTPREGGRSRRH